MRRPQEKYGEINYWIDFFLKGLPLNYHLGRLQVEVEGDLNHIIKNFQRHDSFIKPLEFCLSNGSINFSKENLALDFLYGCESIKLSNVKFRSSTYTVPLPVDQNQIYIKILKIKDVNEDFPFTESTLKIPTIEKLSLRNCSLKVSDKLDTKCHLKSLKFKNSSIQIEGKDDKSLKTLKKMLNSTKSNLEFLSLEHTQTPSIEEYLDFVSAGFPQLTTLELCLLDQVTLGQLASFSRLHRALLKPKIISVLVLKV